MHVGMDVDPGRVQVDVLQRGRRGGDTDGKRPVTRFAGLSWLPWPGWLLRLFVWDDHGRLRLEDAGCVRTRCRAPRGVSGTFEVSPTGSIPRRENPAWQVTKDKVEASRAMLIRGQKAPGEIRPQTRDTRAQSRGKQQRGPDSRSQVHGPRGRRRRRLDGFIRRCAAPSPGGSDFSGHVFLTHGWLGTAMSASQPHQSVKLIVAVINYI